MTMSTGRRLTLVLGLPVALAMIGWGSLSVVAAVGQARYHQQAVIPVHGTRLTVSAGDGSISLRPSSDGQVHLSAVVRYSLIRASVSWQSTNHGVSIRGRCPLSGPVGCSFDYRIAVPARLHVDASTNSGDIAARDLVGGVALSTDSGDLMVKDLRGPVGLETSSGSVVATELDARFVTAGSDSGDVSLQFTGVPRRVGTTSGAGDLTIALPGGRTSYLVGASSNSGTITIGVPTNPSSPRRVSAKTNSGDISVVTGKP